MIDIAMLGCDSSHTEAYASLLNPTGAPLHGRGRVRRLWGVDPAQAREKAHRCEIDRVCLTPEEALAGADLALVVGRYGDSHALPASVALRAGIPTYVDKPFTNSAGEALALVDLARSTRTPLASCSPLRFAVEVEKARNGAAALGVICGAVVSGPGSTSLLRDPRASKLHFYGVHAVDLLCSLLGVGAMCVRARSGTHAIWANVTYTDGRSATLNLPLGAREYYHMVVYGTDGLATCTIDPEGDYYARTLVAVLDELPNGQVGSAPIAEAYEGIRILDAIEQSLAKGQEIFLGSGR